MPRPVANVYVDGFNLYRQKVKHHPDTKWLNLRALSELLLPTHDIKRIRYFTALVRPALGTDPQAPIRQQTYVRALRTLPDVSVFEGQFRNDTRRLPIVPITFDDEGNLVKARVRKTEEKGSDVNLGSYMTWDASRDDADVYVLVSNDTDYASTLHLLTEEMGRQWGLFSPVDAPNTRLLEAKPLFIKPIRRGALLASQFPDEIHSPEHGLLSRPPKWA